MPHDPEHVIGYSEEELKEFKPLYNIKNLTSYDFLLLLGNRATYEIV